MTDVKDNHTWSSSTGASSFSLETEIQIDVSSCVFYDPLNHFRSVNHTKEQVEKKQAKKHRMYKTQIVNDMDLIKESDACPVV